MENTFTDKTTDNALTKFYQDFLTNRNNIKNLFATNPSRHEDFIIDDLNCHLDFSKNWIDNYSLKLLCQIADQSKLEDKINSLFNGDTINYTERRAALHTALRNLNNLNNSTKENNKYANLTLVDDAIKTTQIHIKDLCDKISNKQLLGFSNKPFNTIVNIGIGGSDLGPKMAYNALRPYWNNNIQCHFVSNIDPEDITTVLKNIDPETTLFVIASKSFTTEETLANTNTARAWLLQHCELVNINKHFIAVTSNIDKAMEFGITKEFILPVWDWVGGRYSLWSAVGLTIAMGTSYEIFTNLLRGAEELDLHFRQKEWSKNMPVIMALLGIGYINYANCQTHAILPYCKNLEYFPHYMQQLDMESNGKSVDVDNNNISYKTGPIIWGGVGTNGQHAFHQSLHQGCHIIPCDFIVPIETNLGNNHIYAAQQSAVIANAFAQAKTLMEGYQPNETSLTNYKFLPGNKPSNTILLPKLTPYYLGLLIALYEHKIFTQGIIWNINSFDQWGIERGKVVSKNILAHLEQKKSYSQTDMFDNNDLDSSTINLIEQYYKIKEL